MKTTDERQGYLNRHTTPLPNEKAIISILYKDVDGEHIHVCEWRPFNPDDYTKEKMPGKGYIGTAKNIKDPFKGIGFHAWEQNDSEFIYYVVLAQDRTKRVKCNCPCHHNKSIKHVTACCDNGYIELPVSFFPSPVTEKKKEYKPELLKVIQNYIGMQPNDLLCKDWNEMQKKMAGEIERTVLPTDDEVKEWFTANIAEGCSASSGIYKFRLWLKERMKK